MEAAILIVRYAAQVFRLLVMVKNYRRQARKKGLQMVCSLAATGARPRARRQSRTCLATAHS